jgi:hypothetical protein
MKHFKFKKPLFCLMAIFACALCVASFEPVADFIPPDLAGNHFMLSTIATAMVIPSYDLAGLKCVTQGILKELQAKHGKLYVIDVEDEGDNYQFLVRRPTRQHLEIVASYKDDITKINDFIIKNLVVAGNELNKLDDAAIFAGFNLEVSKLLNKAQGFLSKA